MTEAIKNIHLVLGSKKDFDLYILNKNETQDENGIECSPQMELISLCEACKNKVK